MTITIQSSSAEPTAPIGYIELLRTNRNFRNLWWRSQR